MQTSKKAKEFNVFNLLKLLTKHGISLIVNLIIGIATRTTDRDVYMSRS